MSIYSGVFLVSTEIILILLLTHIPRRDKSMGQTTEGIMYDTQLLKPVYRAMDKEDEHNERLEQAADDMWYEMTDKRYAYKVVETIDEPSDVLASVYQLLANLMKVERSIRRDCQMTYDDKKPMINSEKIAFVNQLERLLQAGATDWIDMQAIKHVLAVLRELLALSPAREGQEKDQRSI
jgi:hypothetical protein